MGGGAQSNTAPQFGHRPWDWALQCTTIRPWDWAYACARPHSVNAAHPQKAAKVEQTLRPAAPHLPDELWHRIAGHLSTKEWIGASGTCRQLWQLQLEHLNITATSADGSISARLWLAKQLPGARSIVLDSWPVESALQQEVMDKIRTTMKPVLKDPQSLSGLTVLSMRLGPGEDENAKQSRSTGHHPHMGIRLAPILAKAARLSKLELACRSTSGIPSLANPKHLALRLSRSPMSERISTVLHKMPLLETLQLSHPTANHERQEMDAMLVVPASVQRVELINVCPESLLLDSNRTVVRLIGALCCLQKAFVNWENVRGQLKGLRLYDVCYDFLDDPTEVSDLWDSVEVLQFVRGATSCADMNLHWLPRASLGSLTSLHVKISDLCITIPALPGLKDLCLDCSGTLCMSFENARVSAENLLAFELVYAGLCADGTLEPFWAALKATGKNVALQQYSKVRKRLWHHNGGVRTECTQHKQYRVQYGSCKAGVSSDPWEDLFTACGCEGCLAGLGLELEWTYRAHMGCSSTSFSGGVSVLRRDEYTDGLSACLCGLHSTSTGIFDN